MTIQEDVEKFLEQFRVRNGYVGVRERCERQGKEHPMHHPFKEGTK